MPMSALGFVVSPLVILALILAGCSGTATSTPNTPIPDIAAPDIPATITALEERLSAIPTHTPVPTNTPMPTPTLTKIPAPSPTRAATPTATAIPTPAPSPTPDPTPTPSIEAMVSEALPSVVWVEGPETNGTGFIFEVQDDTAHVLTAHHVVEGNGEIQIEAEDGLWYEAVLVGYDAYRDIAVLSVCCGTFKALPLLGISDTVNVGSEVLSIGYSLGMEGTPTVTRGIVSAVRRDDDMDAWLVQTDASFNQGASGGPLLERSGKVIGLNSFIYTESGDGSPAEGLGFAVSAHTINHSLNRLVRGVRMGPPTPTPTQQIWRRYSNEEHGWDMLHPRDWLVDDADLGNVKWDSPDEYADFRVVTADWAFDSAMDELQMLMDHYEAKDPALFEFIQASAGVLEGSDEDHYAVIRLKYQGSEEFCVEERMAKFLVRDGQGYVLQWGCCVHALDEDEEYRPILEEMVDSFKIR